LRSGFLEYLDSRQLCDYYKRDLIGYLDRYVKQPISTPTDIIRLFSQIKAGREHLCKGLRVLFNYIEILGYQLDCLNSLRCALPKIECGIDLNIPTEADIINSLSRLHSAHYKYQVLYGLLLDSGLRLVEGVNLINSFNTADNVNLGNSPFYRVTIGSFRGSKQAYYGYFTAPTYKQLVNMSGSTLLTRRNASHYYNKYGFIAPKYLRKFAFDKMIELAIPESVADFIEGRVPKRIGAKHYMALKRQADNWYGKYASYLSGLRGLV